MNQIAKTAIIKDNVKIGENVIIHDYAVIYPNTIIENNVEIFEHAVVGKQPSSPGCVERKIEEVKDETIIGENSIISPFCCIYRGVKISNNTLIGDGVSIREGCKIGSYTLIGRGVTVNYDTTIGNNVKIMDNTHITGNAIIEDNVFISTLVATSNDNKMGGHGYNDSVIGPVIKKNAKIGAAASILPNVVIGENSIVGSGAVVTKNVENNKVVMGVPAKVIKDVE